MSGNPCIGLIECTFQVMHCLDCDLFTLPQRRPSKAWPGLRLPIASALATCYRSPNRAQERRCPTNHGYDEPGVVSKEKSGWLGLAMHSPLTQGARAQNRDWRNQSRLDFRRRGG